MKAVSTPVLALLLSSLTACHAQLPAAAPEPACPDLQVALPLLPADELGAVLLEIEAWFGERDRSYTLLGIAYGGAEPHIWFPRNQKHVLIQLQTASLSDLTRARFQLAHEAVHLLDPSVGERVTVLEEGLATYYQLIYIHRIVPRYITGSAKYDSAAALVAELMAKCPSAVKTLRAGGKRLPDISGGELRAACPELPEPKARTLALGFARWNGRSDAANATNAEGAPPRPPFVPPIPAPR